jgi:hypothetical protein
VEDSNDRYHVIVLHVVQLAHWPGVQVYLAKERRQQHRFSAWRSNLLEQAAPVELTVLDELVSLVSAWTSP